MITVTCGRCGYVGDPAFFIQKRYRYHDKSLLIHEIHLCTDCDLDMAEGIKKVTERKLAEMLKVEFVTNWHKVEGLL